MRVILPQFALSSVGRSLVRSSYRGSSSNVSTTRSFRTSAGCPSCAAVRLPPSPLLNSTEFQSKNIVIVKPKLDFSGLDDPGAWERDLRRRGWSGDFDQILQTWRRAKEVYEQRSASKMRLNEIRVAQKKNPEAKSDDMESWYSKYKAMDKIWTQMLDEGTVLEIFRLPNRLHPSMTKESQILRQVEGSSLSQLASAAVTSPNVFQQILESNGVAEELVAVDPALEAAIPELMTTYFPEATPVRNGAFVKSFVLEGCGLPFWDPERTCQVRDFSPDNSGNDVGDKLHLVGGPSLPAFVATFGLSFLKTNSLPRIFVSSGRRYDPVGALDPEGDFGEAAFVETPLGAVFALASDAEAAEGVFETLLTQIEGLFQTAFPGLSYRLLRVGAPALAPCEARRVELRVSGDGSLWKTAAFLSSHGPFISDRLGIRRSKGKGFEPVHTIYGEAFNSAAFVGFDASGFVRQWEESHLGVNGLNT